MARPPSTPPARFEPAPGALVGDRHRLIERLGKGGMGDVWRARSLQLDIDVAVKLVRGDCTIADAHERLRREARLAARVVHPAAVRVIDHGVTANDGPFLVMELLRGKSLRRRLSEAGPLRPVAAVQLLLPIVDALSVAHREGIVHRDVKPSNVILVEDGWVTVPKLIDFGIACPMPGGQSRRLTGCGMLLGSPDYMAPEQLRPGAEPDARTDVWGVCTLLAESVSGMRPSASEGVKPLLRQARRLGPQRGSAAAHHDAFLDLVARGLSVSPAERYPTMNALASALALWALGAGATWDVTRTSLTTYCAASPARGVR